MTEIKTYEDEQTLEERIKALEKEKKGLINDLQSERGKRQDMEERLSQVETSISAVDEFDGQEKPEQKVTRLAQEPDAYIDARVEERLRERDKRIHQIEINQMINEAYDWVADQEGTTVRKVKGSSLDKDLERIIGQHGLQKLNPFEGTQAAYKILQQEREEKKRKESERDGVINDNSTETVRTTTRTTTGGNVIERLMKGELSDAEYDKHRDEILEFQRKRMSGK